MGYGGHGKGPLPGHGHRLPLPPPAPISGTKSTLPRHVHAPLQTLMASSNKKYPTVPRHESHTTVGASGNKKYPSLTCRGIWYDFFAVKNVFCSLTYATYGQYNKNGLPAWAEGAGGTLLAFPAYLQHHCLRCYCAHTGLHLFPNR